MILAARELNISPTVLQARIIHHVTNVVPVACMVYAYGIKDRHKTMIFTGDPYNIDMRGSPTNIMEGPQVSGEHTNPSGVNESAMHLLELSKTRAD